MLLEPGEPESGLVFDTNCSEDMLSKKLAAFDPNSFAGKETSRSAYRIRDHGYADLRYCR